MPHFFLRTIGKAQETWQKDAIAQYVERIKPFGKIEVIELSEGHGGSAKPDEEKTRAIEAETLLKGISADSYVIALDEVGKNYSSVEFSKLLEREMDNGRSITFLIGGSWGLHASVRERANSVVSFGKQTLPHLLARIILLEQLYRVQTIIQGKTYHK
mgnify:CR=1 FL=1